MSESANHESPKTLFNSDRTRFSQKGLHKLLSDIKDVSSGEERVSGWVIDAMVTQRMINRLASVFDDGWSSKEEFVHKLGESGLLGNEWGLNREEFVRTLGEDGFLGNHWSESIDENTRTPKKQQEEIEVATTKDTEQQEAEESQQDQEPIIPQRSPRPKRRGGRRRRRLAEEDTDSEQQEAPSNEEQEEESPLIKNEKGRKCLTKEGLESVISIMKEVIKSAEVENAEKSKKYRESIEMSDLGLDWTLKVPNLYTTLLNIVWDIKKRRKKD